MGKIKEQEEGMERQCRGSQGQNAKDSKRAWEGNVMAVKGKMQRATRWHRKAMLGETMLGNLTFLEAAATFSRNSSTTSFSFCSSMTDDMLSPAFT